MDQDINKNSNLLRQISPTEPLVSIIVITYNSAKYVLETLESAKVQTYNNIELIISDDCSTDETIAICKDWVNENRGRFVRVELISSEKNTGISANCNRGSRAAKGEWIKLIAGDDVFDNQALEYNKDFFSDNSIELICGTIYQFTDSITESKIQWPLYIFPKSIKIQRKLQLIGSFMHAPSVFIRKSLLIELEYFDEEFPYLEDDPFWIKALINNTKFHFNEKSKIYYRKSLQSISSCNEGELYKPLFFDSWYNFRKTIVQPLMLKECMLVWYFLSDIELKASLFLMKHKKEKVTYSIKFMLLILSFINKIRYLNIK